MHMFWSNMTYVCTTSQIHRITSRDDSILFSRREPARQTSTKEPAPSSRTCLSARRRRLCHVFARPSVDTRVEHWSIPRPTRLTFIYDCLRITVKKRAWRAERTPQTTNKYSVAHKVVQLALFFMSPSRGGKVGRLVAGVDWGSYMSEGLVDSDFAIELKIYNFGEDTKRTDGASHATTSKFYALEKSKNIQNAPVLACAPSRCVSTQTTRWPHQPFAKTRNCTHSRGTARVS